jgi:hypothetical protein
MIDRFELPQAAYIENLLFLRKPEYLNFHLRKLAEDELLAMDYL